MGERDSLGDGQGTRIGPPDDKAHATPATHNDGPSTRPERSTGAGREATQGTEKQTDQHRSGYGGKGGAPDQSSDKRK